MVAVKKCFDAFQNSTDAQRTFREIMYLQALSGHENIIQILNVLKAENDKDIYIVTDFMESDLHAVVKAGILQDIHKQYIIYQILRALKFMHSGDLIHRDIKPSNILLNSDCAIKMCDFGLARSVNCKSPASGVVMTDYVATRWYRAPEILLGSPHYTKGVDVWAVGCILGELILGKPVFAGNSTLDQIERIIQATGKPSSSEVSSIKSVFAGTMLESITCPVYKRNNLLQEMFPRASRDMIDFLSRCLQFSPEKRWSVNDLLKHPLMAPFHDESTEPVCSKPPIEIPLDDNVKLTASDYRTRLYDGVIRRKKEINRDAANRGAVEKNPAPPLKEVPKPDPPSPVTYATAHQRTSYRPSSTVVKEEHAAPSNATSSATESFFSYLFGGGRWL